MKSIDRYRQISELHMSGINEGFLSSLGIGVLSLLYKSIDESTTSCLILEFEDEHLVGFVSGTTSMSEIYRNLLRHPFKLGLEGLKLILQPKKVWRVLEILLSNNRRKGPGLPSAELLSIVVSPAYRGTNVAKKLYNSLCDVYPSGFIIVVGSELIAAQKFYSRMGAHRIGEVFVHGDQKSYLYCQYPEAPERTLK